MCIRFGPLSSNYFFSLFSTCELVPYHAYANLGYKVYLFMSVTPPIIGNFADVLYMVLNVQVVWA